MKRRAMVRAVAGTSAFLIGAAVVFPRQTGTTMIKTERFDHDPGWEGFDNRVQVKKVPTVTQDFGYSHAESGGKTENAIGGNVTRSAKPAFYAAKIDTKTLQDKLSASGTFAITACTGNSGIFFGWFNANQPGGSGRPINSLGMDFDGEGSGARLAVRMINSKNQSCGTFITPFIPGKYRPTPIRKDGTKYHWTLTYDPDGTSGKGRFSFTIKSDRSTHEPFEGKEFSVDLPDGFKQTGASFDHFGMMNAMKAGGVMTIFFDDLVHDGKSQDLAKDPGWEQSGNRAKYQEENPVGAHDFGFSAGTSFAGGSPGEVGGKFWRSGNYGYYADPTGRLTMAQPLAASGKVVLLVGSPDSDMFFGWFSSASRENSPDHVGDFLGIHVGGPTRVGHYFQPVVVTKSGPAGKVKTGPVLTPGKVYDWLLKYDPAANGGKGAVEVKLGNEKIVLELKGGDKTQAVFDRFGLFTSTTGGQMVRIYLDDLSYTVSEPKP